MTEIHIDPEGDLILEVCGGIYDADSASNNTIDEKPRSNGPKAFRVCSRTLSRQSKVFKDLIAREAGASTSGSALTSPTPGTLPVHIATSSKMAETIKLALTKVDPAKMELLLLILHGWYQSVPETLSLDDLLQLVLLADRFEMVPVLRHWADRWVPAIDEFREGTPSFRLLKVLWVLGAANTFEQVLTRLVVTSHLDVSEGGSAGAGARLVDRNGRPVGDLTPELIPRLKGWPPSILWPDRPAG